MYQFYNIIKWILDWILNNDDTKKQFQQMIINILNKTNLDYECDRQKLKNN